MSVSLRLGEDIDILHTWLVTQNSTIQTGDDVTLAITDSAVVVEEESIRLYPEGVVERSLAGAVDGMTLDVVTVIRGSWGRAHELHYNLENMTGEEMKVLKYIQWHFVRVGLNPPFKGPTL